MRKKLFATVHSECLSGTARKASIERSQAALEVKAGETFTLENQLFPIRLCYSPVRDERSVISGGACDRVETTARMEAGVRSTAGLSDSDEHDDERIRH